jgi:hypothetical protein
VSVQGRRLKLREKLRMCLGALRFTALSCCRIARPCFRSFICPAAPTHSLPCTVLTCVLRPAHVPLYRLCLYCLASVCTAGCRSTTAA